MNKSLLLAIAAAGVALFTAQAAMAYGCHRSCEEGKRGWHRHVGHNCTRISCERPRRYQQRCVTKCTGLGPFKTCKTRCD